MDTDISICMEGTHTQFFSGDNDEQLCLVFISSLV